MNLRQLEYFVQVAEQGSFSKAARALHIAQPALSRQVRALETGLRETLLLRNGRGVALTDAGQRLLAHAATILQQLAQAREELTAGRDEPVGRVAVGLPPSIARMLTVPLVEAFAAECPKARLAIVEGLSAHVSEWITAGRVDIGLLYNPEALPGLELTPLLKEPLCLVQRVAAPAPRGRRAAAPSGEAVAPLPLKRLSEFDLIVPDREHFVRRLVETQAAQHGVALRIAWEVSSVPAILDLVAAGRGQAVLTASAVTGSRWIQRLQVRRIERPPLSSVLCLATSTTRRGGPLARRTAQILSRLISTLAAAPAAHADPA